MLSFLHESTTPPLRDHSDFAMMGLMMNPANEMIQAKVTLADIDPPIWRRLLLSPALNLAQLHEVLQAAFGWEDTHLHRFVIGGLTYGAPEMLDDGLGGGRIHEASEVELGQFEFHAQAPIAFRYDYDFGDNWRYEIVFEDRIANADVQVGALCIDGARSAPPEDVGGPWSYEDFLEAWSNPDHEDHKHYRRWAGRSFEPERFDAAKVSKAIATALRKARGGYRFRLAR